MSDLTDFLNQSFDAAATIMGTVSFTVPGITGTFIGVFDRAAKNEKGQDAGFLPDYDATLVAELDQFPSEPGVGKNLAIGSDLYRIQRLEVDAIAYTFYLANRVR
jgi:hypothetical protein